LPGCLAPAKGYVEINGLRRRSSEATELQIRKQVAFLSDHPWLPEFMTLREWLLAGGQLYDVDQDNCWIISDACWTVSTHDKGDAPIRTCSNGQKKKVAICGASSDGSARARFR